MGSDSVVHASGLEQARLVREGAISSEELVRLHLRHIERLNPQLHAFVQIISRRALLAARLKDGLRRAGRRGGPFEGVPLGIKDLNVVRGTPTRFGSRAMPHIILPIDDVNVRQLRRGGFVILGKLATSELGAMPVTEPDIHPPTRNPWHPAHTAGGSSGGSGAAVASGMLPVAQGSDGAGSIRIPAAFCHLFGLKPSRGRVPNSFGIKDERVLYTSGPIARTVEDAAAMLDVMAGLVDGRPHWAPPPERPFAQLVRARPRRMQIYFTTCSPLTHRQAHPEIAAATRRALAVLEGLGHRVEERSPPEGDLEEFLPLWQVLIGRTPFARFARAQPITRWLGEAGLRIRRGENAALFARLKARLAPPLEAPDLWVTPTVSQPPPPIGAFGGVPPAEGFAMAAELGAFTAAFNITGQPAASLPLGLTADGLPIGLQIAGRLHAEADVLQVARELEEAMPWSGRRPPIS